MEKGSLVAAILKIVVYTVEILASPYSLELNTPAHGPANNGARKIYLEST